MGRAVGGGLTLGPSLDVGGATVSGWLQGWGWSLWGLGVRLEVWVGLTEGPWRRGGVKVG